VTHARDIWWTLDFANAFVSQGVNSRGELVPSHGASRRRLGDNCTYNDINGRRQVPCVGTFQRVQFVPFLFGSNFKMSAFYYVNIRFFCMFVYTLIKINLLKKIKICFVSANLLLRWLKNPATIKACAWRHWVATG
jgi:hypothetical protein